MNQNEEAIKQRLSSLTAAQRALLATRLNGTNGRSEASIVSRVAMAKETPLRIDLDLDGKGVAVYRASNSQQRMWFLQQYMPDSPAYSTPTAFRLRGHIQVEILEAAFQELIRRHDSLRTTFAMEGEELVQRVASSSGFRLERVSNSETSPQDRKSVAERRINDAACVPFDVAVPPFRVVLSSIANDEHLLLVVMHHIITDGWSASNLVRELSAIYTALAVGTSIDLPQLPVQFADYSAWQRRWLEGGAFEEQARYWKAQLAGEHEPLMLPLDRPRPALESFRGDECTLQIPPELVADLRARARNGGATLFMVLLAAFKVLLHRYTGQTNLLVGVPIANRKHSEVEGLIGLFANTLVMRTEVSGDATFEELLDRVKRTALGAYEHQDMPFEVLVRLLQVRRDASRSPLFQAAFTLQDFPEVKLDLAGLEVTPFPVSVHTSRFDLTLAVRPGALGLMATMEFNSDLFTRERTQQMLNHWQAILMDAAGNPAKRVSEISLLSPPEKHRILVEWNSTEMDYPRDKCIHQLFMEQALRTPDEVAVRCGAQELTYLELDRRSNLLVRNLRELGVVPEMRVGVCVERSVQLLVGLLGTLKAGGAYVPLDPHLPPARLATILEDAEAPFLVTERSLAPLCPGFTGTRVFLEESTSREDATLPEVEVSSANAAYVIYTSGSEGRPKGVVVEHRSAVNLLHSMRTEPGFHPQDVLLAVTTIAFDISVVELFLPLSVGACVVIVPDAIRADGPALAALIGSSGATFFQATPATWQMLLHSGWKGDRKLKALTGGEALSADLADQLLDQCGELWNVYGPTETTISCLEARIRKGDAITIGGPLANTLAYVVDPHGQPAPIGVPGELLIGGAGVARGYLKLGELTAERFIRNPFSSDPAARLYRTGDLARWRPDGNIEFLGRLDTQVKVRGFRIELGEIETELRAQPELRDAVVSNRVSAHGDVQLVAYLVAKAPEKPDTAMLRSRLEERLPDYMLPNAYVWLDQLPLTPSGKVDRRSLPAPETDRGVPQTDSHPISLIEVELIRIWRRFFQRDDIGRHDNFFALGGHSLLATRLATEIDKVLGRKLPIAALFQSPTIGSLAARLSDENWVPTWSSLVPLQPQGSGSPLFFVHGLGGDLYQMVSLARLMPPDLPCFGIQAVGLDGKSERHATVEDMAAHYVSELISFQAEGPFYLVGYSLGGLIAFEIAQQLRRTGRRVALLALLDTRPSPAIPWFYYALAMSVYIPRGLLRHLRPLWELPSGERFDYFRKYWKWMRFLIFENNRSRAAADVTPLLNDPSAESKHSVDYYYAASRSYQLCHYPGKVDAFVSEDSNLGWRLYWKRLSTGGASFHRIPGPHIEMFSEPNISFLAKSLNAVLQRRRADEQLYASPPG
jgi:amino acid adenylation domain-containing protein